MTKHFTHSLILLFLILITFNGCDKGDEKNYEPQYSTISIIEKKTYIFGIHPLHNPKRLFEVYQPLVDYLNANLKGVTITLEASTNYNEYDKKLFSGHFDFSLPNPYQTVQSTKHGYVIFGKMGDDHNFKGIILVRKDSNIKEISDLKGKSVSYPAPTALAATMMPQQFLHDNGIDINRDIKNLYVGSQESSIMNVFLKESDAAATWPPPWIAFIKERPEVAQEVEIKWETSYLPNNGLVARKDIDPVLISQVASLMFDLHKTKEGKEILKPMELSKFEKADDSTYDLVRLFLENFEKEIRPIRLNQ
ncbi:MAG: phosphate/phosphite/phosphonate ABC transporter substrate-binding protein [Arcobacteraceae bacterium]|nr:phosphate/phosphite/phosphonate ABC transporter substrate-binding protein [Arcobacteraceae bacterium]